jgi:hypothetical protein
MVIGQENDLLSELPMKPALPGLLGGIATSRVVEPMEYSSALYRRKLWTTAYTA